jgi:glycosyltransferase involved in cell wall biosynthesis
MAHTMAKNRSAKRRVLQVIADLDFGGAQSLIYHTWPSFASSERYETSICVFDRLGYFGQRLVEAGARVHCLQARGKYDPSIVSRLRRLVRQERCDLLHVHLFPELYAAACACAGLDISLVYTEHSSMNRRRRFGWIAKALDALAYGPYSRIVAVNASTRANLLRWLPQLAGRTLVIPNGVRLDGPIAPASKADLMSELGIPGQPGPFLILFAGRLTHEKGVDTLISSLALLRDSHVVCLLAGEGDQRSTLERMTADLGLADRIRFLGFRTDVPRLLRQVDLLVLPSRFEGLPLVLLEAMSAGCPVVATAVDGPAEILRGRESALLVPPADPPGLAQAIRLLMGDPQRRKGLSRRALDEVRQFSVENTAGQLFALYDEVCATQ